MIAIKHTPENVILDRWIGGLFHNVGVANKSSGTYKEALNNLRLATQSPRFLQVSESRKEAVLNFLKRKAATR